MPAFPEDDSAEERGAIDSAEVLQLADSFGKKDRKARQQLLERAALEYGTDFVSKLQSIRDPKERILSAAEAVFAKNGFGGARTQEIADLAGVNKAMIHYYFDSKEKLYHAILDQILFDLIKLTQEQLSSKMEPVELVRRFFLGYFDYVASHRHFSRITAMEMGSQDRYLARITETFFKPLFDRGVAFIQEGIDAGVFNKIDPRKLLVTIYAMAMAYFSDAEFIGMVLGGRDPLEEKLLKEHKHFLLEMIFSMLLKKNR